MAKGRPPKADRRTSKETGHRPPPGHGRPPALDAPAIPQDLAALPAPEDLPHEAAEIWGIVLADLAGMRVLRRVDIPLVLAYVEAAWVHAQCSANIHTYGVLVKGPTGPMPNPLLKVQKDAAATLRQISDVLGLSPMARIRANLIECTSGSLLLDIRDRLMAKLDE